MSRAPGTSQVVAFTPPQGERIVATVHAFEREPATVFDPLTPHHRGPGFSGAVVVRVTGSRAGATFTSARQHRWEVVWWKPASAQPEGWGPHVSEQNSEKGGDHYALFAVNMADPLQSIETGAICELSARLDAQGTLVRMLKRLPKVAARFPAILGSATGTGWPRQYNWNEAEPLDVTPWYRILTGGRAWTNPAFGRAINRLETVTGFGASVGPYGQSLSFPNGTLTVAVVGANTPVIMEFEQMILPGGQLKLLPRFEAANPLTPNC